MLVSLYRYFYRKIMKSMISLRLSRNSCWNVLSVSFDRFSELFFSFYLLLICLPSFLFNTQAWSTMIFFNHYLALFEVTFVYWRIVWRDKKKVKEKKMNFGSPSCDLDIFVINALSSSLIYPFPIGKSPFNFWHSRR